MKLIIRKANTSIARSQQQLIASEPFPEEKDGECCNRVLLLLEISRELCVDPSDMGMVNEPSNA